MQALIATELLHVALLKVKKEYLRKNCLKNGLDRGIQNDQSLFQENFGSHVLQQLMNLPNVYSLIFLFMQALTRNRVHSFNGSEIIVIHLHINIVFNCLFFSFNFFFNI